MICTRSGVYPTTVFNDTILAGPSVKYHGMKLLIIQILALILIEGSLGSECKVCDEGLLSGDSIESGDFLGDNICSYIEADNMGSCQSEDDVCVTYSTSYDIFQDGYRLFDNGVVTRSYRCGVEADLDGSNSAFCGDFKRGQDAEISREFSSQIENFWCEVTATEKIPAELKRKLRRKTIAKARSHAMQQDLLRQTSSFLRCSGALWTLVRGRG